MKKIFKVLHVYQREGHSGIEERRDLIATFDNLHYANQFADFFSDTHKYDNHPYLTCGSLEVVEEQINPWCDGDFGFDPTAVDRSAFWWLPESPWYSDEQDFDSDDE